MLNPIQVANIYIKIANSEKEGSITNLKLNKLLYYAQGWSLARFGRSLFEEDILAWQFGPIVASVYRAFNIYGSGPIVFENDMVKESPISKEEMQLLLDVYRAYGRYSPATLVEMTHEVGTPWQKVYNGSHSTIIPKEEIQKYFINEKPLQTFEMPKLHATIGRVDKNGITILPCDDDGDDDYE